MIASVQPPGDAARHRYLDEMRAGFEALAAQIDAVLKRSQ